MSQPALIPTPPPDGFPRAQSFGKNLVLRVFIPGNPVAKGRPKARVIAGEGKKPFPQFYTPKETKDYEEHVAKSAVAQLRSVDVEGDEDFTLPVRDVRVLMNVRFNIEKPVSYPKSVVHVVRKPDIDNLVKSLLDGLVNARILEDDNCITDLMTSKRYAGPGHPVGVEVEMTCLPV